MDELHSLSDVCSAPSDTPITFPPVSSPRGINTPTQSGGVWLWLDDEAKAYDEILAGYESQHKVDWEDVADELQKMCPPSRGMPARSAVQCRSRLYYLKTRALMNRKPPSLRWTPEALAELSDAVKTFCATNNTQHLSGAEWSKLGQTLSSPRTGSGCSQRYAQLRREGGLLRRPRNTESRHTEEQEAAIDAMDAVDTKRSVESSVHPTSTLVRDNDHPFSPEDDERLLELYTAVGPAYKSISRQMSPQRHKKDTQARLDYLLKPYDFSHFFPRDEVE